MTARDRYIGDLFDPAVWTASGPVLEVEEDLLAEERLLVARAVPRRRYEFAAGRRAARALLAQLGHPDQPLLRNDDRSPRWPATLVGSISHCDALCVVALGARSRFAGLGVDVEPDQPLEPAIRRKICTPGEIAALLGGQADAERGRVARLVFSAKEATYKSVYPLVGKVFGFQDVELAIDWEAGTFTPRLDAAIAALLPSGLRPAGTFARRDGFVFAAATVRAA